jgi:hypothetical protein
MPVNTNDVSEWAGWAFFAGILMGGLGVAQAILGVSEIGQKKLLFVFQDKLVSNSYFLTWGWIDVVIGVLLVAAGFSMLHGGAWARIGGVFFAGLALIANLVFLPIYPLWAVVSIALSVFIIYSLVVRSGEAKH